MVLMRRALYTMSWVTSQMKTNSTMTLVCQRYLKLKNLNLNMNHPWKLPKKHRRKNRRKNMRKRKKRRTKPKKRKTIPDSTI